MAARFSIARVLAALPHGCNNQSAVCELSYTKLCFPRQACCEQVDDDSARQPQQASRMLSQLELCQSYLVFMLTNGLQAER